MRRSLVVGDSAAFDEIVTKFQREDGEAPRIFSQFWAGLLAGSAFDCR